MVTLHHIHSKGEGYRKSITSKPTVTDDGIPSGVWIRLIARGQQSTDSITAGQSLKRATRLHGETRCTRYETQPPSTYTVALMWIHYSVLTSRYHIIAHRSAVMELLTELEQRQDPDASQCRLQVISPGPPPPPPCIRVTTHIIYIDNKYAGGIYGVNQHTAILYSHVC